MATAKKKKTTAKRPAVKHVTKAAAQPAIRTAQDWQKESAKLYQFPFTQSDAGASMQSATENFMRMGSDALKQWWEVAQQGAVNPEAMAEQAKAKVTELFSQVPGFDAAQAQEKLASFSRESAEQFTKSAQGCGKAMNEAFDLSRENAEAVMEVTAVAVTLSKELGAELIGYTNRTFSQNVELSKQALACRTLNDLFDLGSRIMKSNLDGYFSESVKLSELLFKASTDVSEPLNERLSESSERLSKVLAA